jgi:hypothetical protein
MTVALSRKNAPATPRTETAPSPPWGEGWGEGVRIHSESLTPHPIPLPTGEGADRVRRYVGEQLQHKIPAKFEAR